MYHILVAEDEPLERMALQNTLTQEFEDQCSVVTAENGQRAVVLANEVPFDILLMDINMPGINGLEAARIIKEDHPNCKLLFLTAYPTFQYAQKAVSLGAIEYLLKPLSDDELIRKINRCLEELREEKLRIRQNDTLNYLIDKKTEEQFVLAVISGYDNLQHLNMRLNQIKLYFKSGFLFICRCRQHIAQLDCLLRQNLPEGRLLSFEYDGKLYCIFFSPTLPMDSGAYAEMLHRLHLQTELELQASVQLGAGRQFKTLGELHTVYEQAEAALAGCKSSAPVVVATDGQSIAETANRLYLHILECDVPSVTQYLEDIVAEAYTTAQPLIQLTEILQAARETLQNDLKSQSEEPYLQPIHFQNGIDAPTALSACTQAAQAWMQVISSKQLAHSQQMIGIIVAYINRNYMRDLCVSKVAKDLHYSANYFSKLFKRYFHTNFVNYLMEVRIQKAEALLADPLINIKDISERVGFSDPNYFSKVFKKYCAQNPSEYRATMYKKEADQNA